MDEKVEKILEKVYYIKTPLYDGLLEPYAQEIRQLFESEPKTIKASSGILHPESDFEPKPDESRLLTEEKIISEASKDSTYCQLSVDIGLWARAEQDKRTASIKDAEFKEFCANCESWLWKSGEMQEFMDKCEAECQLKVDQAIAATTDAVESTMEALCQARVEKICKGIVKYAEEHPEYAELKWVIEGDDFWQALEEGAK